MNDTIRCQPLKVYLNLEGRSESVIEVHELVSVTIKPDACDPEDVEMLQDMIVAAANEAMRQMDEIAEKEMSSVTGGMGLPGGLF